MCGARARSLYTQCERGVRVLYVCYACAATCDSGIAHILPSFEERICLLNVVEGASLFHRRIYFQTREKSLPLNHRRRHRRHFVCTVFVQFIKYIRVFCSEIKKILLHWRKKEATNISSIPIACEYWCRSVFFAVVLFLCKSRNENIYAHEIDKGRKRERQREREWDKVLLKEVEAS